MICKCKVTPKEVTADLPLLFVQSYTTFQQTQLDAKFLQCYTCTLNISGYLYCSLNIIRINTMEQNATKCMRGSTKFCQRGPTPLMRGDRIKIPL